MAEKSNEEMKPEMGEAAAAVEQQKESGGGGDGGGGGGGGWGGWGFSLSYLSDLQKAVTVAAEEISRNAVEAAKTAAKSITDMQIPDEESESSKEDEKEASAKEEESEDENTERQKMALDKLEKASEDSLLGQGLKAFDNSVESFTSGAWQALGSALKEGATLVQKLENSASNFTESIQHGGQPVAAGSVVPSLIETGRAFTAKGLQVLEVVGKETMDLLIAETGLDIEKNKKESDGKMEEDQLFEDISFERCFYIYGGPEQLEELEALSSHYVLPFNRRKAKLSPERKSIYDGKLKEVQDIFDLGAELDGSGMESEKGKKVEAGTDYGVDEMKNLHESSIRKAAELAAGFTNTLSGLAPNDVIQRTVGRLDSLQSEGVHRLSEMCCYAMTQLLVLGKSMISNANKMEDQEINEKTLKIEWPDDSVERAKIIRTKAQSMIVSLEAISNSFITGISDVAEAYSAAIKSASADSQESPEKSVQKKVDMYSESLRTGQTSAVGNIQDGLRYLSCVVVSTSMPAA